MITLREQLVKASLLHESGFTFLYKNLLYVNFERNKVFSIQFIKEKRIDIIAEYIDKPVTKKWAFYFNEKMSATKRKQLESILEYK